MTRDLNRLEETLGRVLSLGSTASTALLAVGLALILAGPRTDLASFFLNAGLLTLIATPVARVLVSTVQYAAEREWTFLLLTTTVLLVLLASWLVA